MQKLLAELNSIATLLIQGQVGEANSRWNSALNDLSPLLRKLPADIQQHCLPPLRQILACQQAEDWIGMADGLRFSLPQAMDKCTV